MALYRPQGSEVGVLSVADGCYRHTPKDCRDNSALKLSVLASSVLKWDRDLPQTVLEIIIEITVILFCVC